MISIKDSFFAEASSFVNNHMVLCGLTLGLAVVIYTLGNLAGRAVLWIKECCGIAKKTDSVARETIVYMSITAFPVHMGHMSAVAEAIKHLQEKKFSVKKAYISVADDDYLNSKLSEGDKRLNLEQRKELVNLTIQHATEQNMFRGVTVAYTKREQIQRDHPPVYRSLVKKHVDKGVFFVCGPDLYPKTAHKFENVIVLGREGMEAPAQMSKNHDYLVPQLYPQFANLSSTKVRTGKASLQPPEIDQIFRKYYDSSK